VSTAAYTPSALALGALGFLRPSGRPLSPPIGSTVRNADRIVVLEKGRIVGEGTHATLLECSALYRALCRQMADSATERPDETNAKKTVLVRLKPDTTG
jgi:hypothetical protein